MLIRGPVHSLYPKVVSPLKMTYTTAIRYLVLGLWSTKISTLVPLCSLVRSRVTPAGTLMLSSTMVEQAFLLAMALAAEVKVQVEDERSTISETLEGAGAADTKAAPRANMETKDVRILK